MKDQELLADLLLAEKKMSGNYNDSTNRLHIFPSFLN